MYFSLALVLGFKHFFVNINRRIHINSPGGTLIFKTLYLSFINFLPVIYQERDCIFKK